MWAAFGIGVGLGFLGAVPPGPVGLAILRYGVEEGRNAGFRVGAGALLVDLPCVFVAAELASRAAAGLDVRLDVDPVVVVLLRLAIAALLVGIGLVWMWRPRRPAPEAAPDGSADPIAAAPVAGAFLSGVGLALAHLASPTFLPWLAVIAGALQARGLLRAEDSVVFTLGFGVGTFVWFAALATIAASLRDRMRQDVLVAAHRFAGAALVGFGLLLVAEGVAPWLRG